jgi:hypothetical protein
MTRFSSIPRSVAAAACAWALLTGILSAAPVGYDRTEVFIGGEGASTAAFAPDGTLYVLENAPFGTATATMHVFPTGGGSPTTFPITGYGGTAFYVGGMTVHPGTGHILLSENTSLINGQIYDIDPTAVDPNASKVSLLSSSLDYIARLTVRDDGTIYATAADFNGAGGVYRIDAGTPVSVLGGIDYGAGLDFDENGLLVFQDGRGNLTGDSGGRVQRDDADAPGVHDLLGENLFGGFDLTIDSEGDIFITGGETFFGPGALYQLGPGGTETLFDESLGFGSSVDFLAGSQPFEPFQGPNGGVLAYVPSYASPTVVLITPTGVEVPEPASWLQLAIAAIAGFGFWRRRRSAR